MAWASAPALREQPISTQGVMANAELSSSVISSPKPRFDGSRPLLRIRSGRDATEGILTSCSPATGNAREDPCRLRLLLNRLNWMTEQPDASNSRQNHEATGLAELPLGDFESSLVFAAPELLVPHWTGRLKDPTSCRLESSLGLGRDLLRVAKDLRAPAVAPSRQTGSRECWLSR